jgi:hypothetical protein
VLPFLGRLTAELLDTEKALKDRRKTENMLSYKAAATLLTKRPAADRPAPKLTKKATDLTDDPLSADEPSACWNWQFTGLCTFGDRCRHAHQGQAGSMKHLLATEDGTCKNFLQGQCDRGAQCKFDHPDKQGDGLTKTAGKMRPIYAIQNNNSWVVVPGGPHARAKRGYPIRISTPRLLDKSVA